MKIVCCLPVLGHPRHAKRIAMLQRMGISVEVLAFQRPYHDGRAPTCPVIALGTIQHGHYFARLVSFIKVARVFRERIKRSDCVYAFGTDMALLAHLASVRVGIPIVMEVGDIRPVQVARGVVGRIVRRIDRWTASRARLLVVTAEHFANVYYHRWLGVHTQTVILENKVEAIGCESRAFSPPARWGTTRRLRIGYFGMLRCPWAFDVLRCVARLGGRRVEIVCAGYPVDPEDLAERVKEIPNMMFKGKYRSPVDLPGLYGMVDLVWACYPAPRDLEYNWRWARTNRFYESCRYGVPMLALRGSADGAEVKRFGIGGLVDPSDAEAAAKAILAIGEKELKRWTGAIRQLPRSVYECGEEEEMELKAAISSVSRRNEK